MMIFGSFSYSKKLISLMLLLSLIPIALIGGSFYVEKINNETNSLKNQLNSISGIGAQNVEKWINERKSNTENIATNQLFILNTKQLRISDPHSTDFFDSQFVLERQADVLINNYNWLSQIMITDPHTNKILFFTGIEPISYNLNTQEHFILAKQGIISASDIHPSEGAIENEYGFYEVGVPTLFISAPIRGEVGLEGILTIRINVFEMNPSLKSLIDDYSTVDTFVINSEGFMLSKPNPTKQLIDSINNRPELEIQMIDPQTGDKSKILSGLSEGKTSNLDGYNNYLGKNVVGSITPISGTDWYYVVEISKDEAFYEIQYLQIILTSAISLILISVIGGSLVFTNHLVRPIKNLKQATLQVQSGNFDVNLPATNDEIGALAKSFNKMVNSLKESQSLHESAVKKYQDLYEKSPGLNRTINLEGIITDCNIPYARAFGYERDEVIGKSIFDFCSKDSIPDIRRSFELWKNDGEVVNQEMIFQRRDGTTFPGLLSASNLHDEKGNLVGSNTVIRDISDIRSAQKVIEELQMKRLSVIGELTARIAHDMRNPLSVLKNTVEMLILKREGKMDEHENSQWTRVNRAIDRMQHQIEDVLDYLRNTPLTKKDHYLSQIVSDSIDRIHVPEHITIHPPLESITIHCDSEKLEVVFVNLFMNAIQAIGGQKGAITVTGKEISDRGDFVLIEVKDTGPGIPPEIIPKIFDPLFTTRQVGTGLGLPSCKNIIEKHGGTISVSSIVGKETKFTIKLPKNKEWNEFLNTSEIQEKEISF
ncbi:MAG: PAS domain S-box protein [Crenarchaeota archaeon]|nr:MAG: PAS domain S-box protein [Thermoproteota archaeon]RDJ33214.1 MAG: PAS domain S-box protein [Thermoproteota archaeon]RDJ36283.1 MAG: PAS domain S-box protein [Thermoproteota archaeon]RDJ38912.1 MAG: PAS domain S-box protein [Thermoproteota archaeon]